MKINIINQKSSEIKKAIKKAVNKAIEVQNQPNDLELSVKFVSVKEIQELNKTTRNIDKPTDVLSYPSLSLKPGERIQEDAIENSSFDGKNIYIGDCAICEDVAAMQAKERKHTLESEIVVLVVHSVLHMLGYDHIKDEDYKLMHKCEDKILGELKNV